MDLKKNQILELEITGMTHDGNGVGRIENFVIFVPACAQGELVRVQILSVKKNLAYAKLLEVIRLGESRIEPDCPVFMKCGGCTFRHITYEEELHVKWTRVRDALRKIAGIEMEPEEILGSENIDGYRNKAQYPVGYDRNGELIAGFYAPHSHRIISNMCCRLQPETFGKILAGVLKWMKSCGVSAYDETTGKGLVRHVYLRQARSTGQTVVCLVINGDSVPNADKLVDGLKKISPEICGIILNINKKRTNVILGSKCVTICGSELLTDTLGEVKYEISPLSFYQVNSAQTVKLYNIARDFAQLSAEDTLLDLYCGAGTIGLFMARSVKKVIGVEVVPEAIDDARRNAELNGIENADFICADAGEAAKRLLAEKCKPDVVVVDPPRKGCDDITINSIVEMAPRRVVYVSCDPATLARDIAIFTQKGYKCVRVKPVDMFPRTPHVECVALMSRVN